jgi:hypothetical protein
MFTVGVPGVAVPTSETLWIAAGEVWVVKVNEADKLPPCCGENPMGSAKLPPTARATGLEDGINP